MLIFNTILPTVSKLFCTCKADMESTCPRCQGLPGTIPVLNKKAVEYAVKAGLLCNASINESFSFVRKKTEGKPHKGYIITQHDHPICSGGFISLEDKKIVIKDILLEEDEYGLPLLVINIPDRDVSGQDLPGLNERIKEMLILENENQLFQVRKSDDREFIFYPEPNIPVIKISKKDVEKIKQNFHEN